MTALCPPPLSLSRAGTISGRFVVLDTDYKTYMVLFHCMQMSILGSRKTVYVLSKDGAKITDERLDQVRLYTVDGKCWVRHPHESLYW